MKITYDQIRNLSIENARTLRQVESAIYTPIETGEIFSLADNVKHNIEAVLSAKLGHDKNWVY